MTESFLKNNDVYEKFNAQFLRRVFHFSLGFIDKVIEQGLENPESDNLINDLFSRIDKNGYSSSINLVALRKYDNALHGKYVTKRLNLVGGDQGATSAELESYRALLAQKDAELNSVYSSIGYRFSRKLVGIMDV